MMGWATNSLQLINMKTKITFHTHQLEWSREGPPGEVLQGWLALEDLSCPAHSAFKQMASSSPEPFLRQGILVKGGHTRLPGLTKPSPTCMDPASAWPKHLCSLSAGASSNAVAWGIGGCLPLRCHQHMPYLSNVAHGLHVGPHWANNSPSWVFKW